MRTSKSIYLFLKVIVVFKRFEDEIKGLLLYCKKHKIFIKRQNDFEPWIILDTLTLERFFDFTFKRKKIVVWPSLAWIKTLIPFDLVDTSCWDFSTRSVVPLCFGQVVWSQCLCPTLLLNFFILILEHHSSNWISNDVIDQLNQLLERSKSVSMRGYQELFIVQRSSLVNERPVTYEELIAQIHDAVNKRQESKHFWKGLLWNHL